MNRTAAIASVIAIAGASADARADTASPDDLVARPLALRAGQIDAELVLEVGIDPKQITHPLSIAPDAWIGATDRLTIGITHSDAALDEPDSGASICLRQSELTCEERYHGGVLDARYAVIADDGVVDVGNAWYVAPRARLLIRWPPGGDADPDESFIPATTLGALARWQRGRFAVTADPYLQLGLIHQQLGNRAHLAVPVYFAVQPAARVSIELETGYISELHDGLWKDDYHVPIALEVRARATAHFDVALQGGLTSGLGPQNNAKEREVWLVLGFRS